MATIVFAIADSISHYNASYEIASQLKGKGHKIIYIADSVKHEKDVIEQGFSFVVIYSDFFKKFESIKSQGKLKRLHTFALYLHELKRYKQLVLAGTEINNIITNLKPDLFLVDVFHIVHVLSILKFKVKVILLQTYLCTNKAYLVPPLTSSLIPTRSFHYYVVEYLWFKLFASRWIWSAWNSVILLGRDTNSIFHSLVKANNFPKSEIDYRRAFHLGIKSIPELILSAKEFDFPRTNRENQHYVGPMVNLNRRDVSYDPEYLVVMLDREIQEAAGEKGPRPIVYCSLGTIGVSWYKHCERFFINAIEAFRHRPDCDLYISVGTDIKLENFTDVPANVFIFQMVPQMDILEKASLMITHGGINSINECIMLGVPLMVYPLSADIDQNGNAARVEYHGLGIRGNIRRETPKGILAKVDSIFSSPDYKINLEKMRDIYAKYDSEDKASRFILSYLAK